MNHGRLLQLRGRVKQRLGKLTGREMLEAEGSFDYVCGMLQERYALSRHRAAALALPFFRRYYRPD